MKNMKRAKRRKRNFNKIKKVLNFYKQEFGGSSFYTADKIKEKAHKYYNEPGKEIYRCNCSYCQGGRLRKLRIAEINEEEQIKEWQTDKSLVPNSHEWEPCDSYDC